MRASVVPKNDLPKVLVVGGGLSGLAVAQRLAAIGGLRVDVAEAGGRAAEDHMNALYSTREIEDMWRIPGEDPTLWRPWDSAAPPHYDGATGLRRQLGGRSVYWHGVVLRMDSWALAGADSWPNVLLDDGLAIYDSVERDLAAWCGRGLQEPRSATEDSFLAWVRSIGYHRAQRTPLAVQRFDTVAGPRWRAYSPLYAGTESSPAVREHSAVRCLVGQSALSANLDARRPAVLLKDNRTGHIQRVEADAVVLAAGTIENTRVVAQLLAGKGAGPDHYVGLNDHILQGFAVLVARSPWGSQGGEGSCLVVRGDADSRSNFFAKLLDGPEPSSAILNVWEMGEQEPSELNRIEFPDRAKIPWRPVVRAGLTAADESVVTGQQVRLRKAWDAVAEALGLPTTRLDFGDYGTAPRDVTGFLERAVARPGTPIAYATMLGSIDHEAGTLPYGRLLDPSGQVAAAPGVFVVGPAAFPRSGAANPSLTSLAVARHVADDVASSLGVP